MKYQEITVLLPCHSLEDFPVHQEGDDAEGLLAAWTALWHPRLIASAARAPAWQRVDDPPQTFTNKLIVIPTMAQKQLQAGWAERAESEGACVVRGETRRGRILDRALAELENEEAVARLDPQITADFLALGFGYLQVELLTRQMRYSSYVDEVYFQNEVTAGAIAAVAGDKDDAESHLQACFDILSQARDQFYPVESYLIDLTLVAPTTLGPSLRRELESGVPLNLLLSGSTLDQMAQQEPATLAALQGGLAAGNVCLVGGEYEELELPLLPVEEILQQLARGRETYLRHLGRTPTIFGRRRFGLCPQLPQILARSGFKAALHCTLDDGKFPLSQQAKCRWEGHDSSTIDCLAKLPLDAAQSSSFINLSHRLGDTMDHDHVATLLFARWPGQSSDWYGDLRRVAARGPALGKFIKLDDYFEKTDTPDRLIRFEADEYQSPYLQQAVAAGDSQPISKSIARQTAQARRSAIATAAHMAQLVNPRPEPAGETEPPATESPALSTAVTQFAAALAGQRVTSPALISTSPAETAGYLVLNPFSHRVRLGLDLPLLRNPPLAEEPVKAIGRRGEQPQAVVDVSALGFVYLAPAPATEREKPSREPALAEGTILRNDYLEIHINPQTGAVQAIREHGQRNNLLSQQVAFRASSIRPRGVMGDWTPPDDPYSVMASDSIEVTACTRVLGEITSRGRLLDKQGKTLAGFSQRVQLWRGSRMLKVELTFSPEASCGADPWDSYYCVRFAWSDGDAHLWRSTGETAHPNVMKRFEAPQFIDLRTATARLALLTGGLPYHQRTGPRMLDTLMIVRGETCRTFTYGVGVNIGNPAPAVGEMLLPEAELIVGLTTPASRSAGWLWHLDSRSVSITWSEPIWEAGRVVGSRLRLLETSGKPGQVRLSCFRPLTKAVQTDYLGNTLCELRTTDGIAQLDFAAYEWVQLEARWEETRA